MATSGTTKPSWISKFLMKHFIRGALVSVQSALVDLNSYLESIVSDVMVDISTHKPKPTKKD